MEAEEPSFVERSTERGPMDALVAGGSIESFQEDAQKLVAVAAAEADSADV